MNSTSILWIGAPLPDARRRALLAAGLYPVAVETVDTALHLLSQFKVSAVVLQIANGRAWDACARVLASGPPVAVLVDLLHDEVARRYQSAGCAAVIDAACASGQLAPLLRRVTAGERGLVYPQ